jgi:hypothetical protein
MWPRASPRTSLSHAPDYKSAVLMGTWLLDLYNLVLDRDAGDDGHTESIAEITGAQE